MTSLSRVEERRIGYSSGISYITLNKVVLRFQFAVEMFWALTESNFSTFVIPNTIFGLLGAIAGSSLISGDLPSNLDSVCRLPIVLYFNWSNLLIFDLANQRSSESVAEDRLNKPWRPIPTGKLSPLDLQRIMLYVVPWTLITNYLLGVWREGLLLQILTWLYNDLGGGDQLARDPIIAFAYALYNHASLNIAVGTAANVGHVGRLWIIVISGAILTTIQVQDLKDQVGDRLRDRQTIPLVLGDSVSRLIIAVFVLIWSIVCVIFWQLSVGRSVPVIALSFFITWRLFSRKNPVADTETWKLWCLWLVVLYLMPISSQI